MQRIPLTITLIKLRRGVLSQGEKEDPSQGLLHALGTVKGLGGQIHCLLEGEAGLRGEKN